MSIEYSFFDPTVDENGLPDREYNAEQFTNYFGALVETGVMRQQGDELKVTVDGTTMNSTIGTGVAFVEDKYMRVKSPYLLTHDTESVGLSRIDRVIVRKDTRIESRHVLPFIKKGVASVNPVAPSLQRDDEVYEISLAQIRIVGGRSYLTSNDITDERAIEALCGWATSKIMPNYSDDTLQGVLTQVQENDVRIGNHEKNAVNHVAYGVATGTNVKTMTANIQFDNLVDGLAVAFKNNTANSGPVTLNVNSKGAKNVIHSDGRPLVTDELKAGSIYTVRYNSTTGNFILQAEGGGISVGSLSSGKGLNLVQFHDGRPPISSDQPDDWEDLLQFKINRSGSIMLEIICDQRRSNTPSKSFRILKNGVVVYTFPEKIFAMRDRTIMSTTIGNIQHGDILKIEAGWNIKVYQGFVWTRVEVPDNIVELTYLGGE